MQRELQVSLLRDTREARLAVEPAAGGHAIHGTATATCTSETEVHFVFYFPFFPGYLFILLVRKHTIFLSTVCINSMWFYRFKSVQKADGFLGDNYANTGHHNPNAAEQTVLAQSQHHQQFLGKEAEMKCSINVWF